MNSDDQMALDKRARKIKKVLRTPDNKWELIVKEDYSIECIDTARINGKYTMEEIIEATNKLVDSSQGVEAQTLAEYYQELDKQK